MNAPRPLFNLLVFAALVLPIQAHAQGPFSVQSIRVHQHWADSQSVLWSEYHPHYQSWLETGFWPGDWLSIEIQATLSATATLRVYIDFDGDGLLGENEALVLLNQPPNHKQSPHAPSRVKTLAAGEQTRRYYSHFFTQPASRTDSTQGQHSSLMQPPAPWVNTQMYIEISDGQGYQFIHKAEVYP